MLEETLALMGATRLASGNFSAVSSRVVFFSSLGMPRPPLERNALTQPYPVLTPSLPHSLTFHLCTY